ncbi:hypothetical protein [Paenibacillus sp. Marseille-Q4541]|uniref:hypothetical protein n=1 Tax=Paenibacillus sp. Marseille-Q4541 TaxID=2831522 RepID=UPI001BADA886|nr:hypothetical protein [Paenibacillus sp. Marseille-Q4541]
METLRCCPEKLTSEDFEEVKKIYTDEKVRRYLGGITPEEHVDGSRYEIVTTI